MTELYFHYFMDYEDGRMARVSIPNDDMDIPVNIFIDNADEYGDAAEGPCAIEICGVGDNVEIFSSEEDYRKAEGTSMAPISMIPMGTFPANDDWEHFEQSPHILYSGKVLDVEWDPSAEPDEPNCDIAIETLGFTFNLYLRYKGKVEAGNIVHGVAWLYGDMVMEG